MLNAGIAQRDRFIERGHAQPARSFFLESPRAFRRAVAVRVGFHHRADGYSRSDVPLHHAEVVAQILQRHLGPGGSGRGPFQNFGGSHCCRL